MHIHVEIRTWKERERGGEEQVKREGEKGKERETTSHGRTSPDRSGIFPLDWNLIKLKICQFRKKHPTAYIDGGHYTPVARQRGRELVGLTTPVQIKTHRRARTPRADRPEPRPTHGPLFLRSLSLSPPPPLRLFPSFSRPCKINCRRSLRATLPSRRAAPPKPIPPPPSSDRELLIRSTPANSLAVCVIRPQSDANLANTRSSLMK